ncbi:hypothetical protein PIROE2DRAFT_68971 [Piromyces sp. E2]|nr:hypothetical protein PIROE2DRAFT_68971 [Piromyces sp. E2]|eukprot:OUM66234.1 hypothetical protein PIROE2DRAFT_68971 [Piromyces sp. E2]
MDYKIVFSDVDGTLLNSEHKLLPKTLFAIRSLQEKHIPFVIISARSPSGIYPILKENNFNCSIISYSGSLILNEDRNILYSEGFSKKIALDIVSFIENQQLDCTWNIFSVDTWIVKDKNDPRVINEENIVKAQAIQGSPESLPEDAKIGKILCMCNPTKILDIERALKEAFPQLSIAKSSNILLEIMAKGINKSNAVHTLCKILNIPLEATVAFGDNFNDEEMLETVAMPFLMGNAPEALKKKFNNITNSNDEDGIYQALVKIGMVQNKGN